MLFRSRWDRAVKMHVFPKAVLLLPHARLFAGERGGIAVRFDPLSQADVRNDGGVADQADVRRGHDRLLRSAGGFQLEIEMMEVHALDDMAESFRLEAGQAGIAEFGVGVPVLGVDRVEQLEIRLQDFSGGIGHEWFLRSLVSCE